ncbi:MAG: hypothetical protein ACLFM0_03220 [Spirochaetales bacterium]
MKDSRLHIETVASRASLRAFISFPKSLYRETPQWVPFFDRDYRALYQRRHPFFRHAEGEFLLVRSGSEVVGRAMMIHNRRYNEHHGRNAAHFYFCDYVDVSQVSGVLFDAMRRWAGDRGLSELTGPLFMGASYGGGTLIEGFEQPAPMTMMPYNHEYYRDHYERAGFDKHFDLCSLSLDPRTFELPKKVERVAELVRARGRMKVVTFRSNRELKRIAPTVAALYNETLADHAENYPLSEDELQQLISDLLVVARPDLEKIIEYDNRIVGYLLCFPDLTPALKKGWGRLSPAALARLWWQHKRAKKLIINGMGILGGYQRLGGNALLYSELAKTGTAPGTDFQDAELVQINEENELMLSDLKTLGARLSKRYRVFTTDV